jgi:N-acetylneuraminic acid mutarotase
MWPKRYALLAPLLAAFLALSVAVVACAGAETTTTSQAVTTTQTSVTPTTQVVTTTTAAPTTTTLSEAVKLEKYRAAMTALWKEYDPKLAAMSKAWMPMALGSTQVSPEDAQKAMADGSLLFKAFVLALAKAEPPQSLAAAHATYLSGNQKMSAAFDQMLEAMKEAAATQKASGIIEAVIPLLSVIENETASMTEAEKTLRAALGVEMPEPVRVPNLWMDLDPDSYPGGRYYSPIAFAPSVGTFLLLGGDGSSETWAYDPESNTWADLMPATMPPFRHIYAMAYAASAGKIILFGGGVFPDSGTGDVKLLNDTWSYDPAANTWTKLNPSGAVPSARAFASMVCDPATGKMILFGGMSNSTGFNDTWSYDPAANTWTKLNPGGAPPSKRGAYAMAYDPDHRVVLIFGGFGRTAVLNDTWAYDPAANKWTKVKSTGPTPSNRFGASMAYDEVSKKVILFGGQDSKDRLLNDTWAYDPAAKKWTELKTLGLSPSGRLAPMLAYDPIKRAVLLFGGAEADTITNETWAFYPAE